MNPSKDTHPSTGTPQGLANASGVACHINAVLLLITHCELSLNPAASIGLGDLVERLRSGATEDLQECYHFLKASMQIDAEELGDPVIALRKLVDTHHPLLRGGVLQTTLTQTRTNDETRTKQLKASRMPNPLPVSFSSLPLDKMFLSRVLSEEPVQNYKWPGDSDDCTTEAITLRQRNILQLPDLLMVHLQPLCQNTSLTRDEDDSTITTFSFRDGDSSEAYYELSGAILHISRSDNDAEEEEGGHTAVIIPWSDAPGRTRSFYLLDDLDAHLLKPNEVETLLQGAPYPYSEPDEVTFSSAVLLVYRKSVGES